MNEKELVETAVSFLTDAACVDVAPLTDQKVALFLYLFLLKKRLNSLDTRNE